MTTFSIAVARILVLGALVALAGHTAAQQDYPSRPIRIISPFPAGGGTTVVARIIAQKLIESWGQQVLVDNRPGGNTIIGSEALVRSKPDGYTLMIHASTHATNPNLFKLPYDTIKDFAPVATVSVNEYMLVVHPSVPANNFPQFMALAKSKPGRLNYGTTGIGSTQHLATELLGVMTGIRMHHVPYKGGGPVITALLVGEIDLAFTSPSNANQHVKTGRFKAIAVSGETRVPAMPQVPTFTEAGLRNFDVTNWYGIFAPAGTPKEIIDKHSTELAKILAMPDVEKLLASQGVKPFFSTPEQFAARIKADIAKYGRVIKTANIKLED